ncbi:hypothetical protein PFISCL1PPCAC_8886, partial [Pristionchus fissidentatus]
NMCIVSSANEQQEEFSECHLTKMPDDVMTEVLLYLDALDRNNLGRSCRRFYYLDNKIGRKKFYRVRLNVLESGYTFLFSTSPAPKRTHPDEKEKEQKWKISFEDISDVLNLRMFENASIEILHISISSRRPNDQCLNIVFHNSRFDSLEVIVSRMYYHDVSFLSSLLRDQNLHNSQITVDDSPRKSITTRISERFSRIISTVLSRTASNPRVHYPPRPEYDEGKMEVFADAILGHLVPASMTTLRSVYNPPFTTQAIVDAFRMTCVTEEPKFLHLSVRATVVAEVEALLCNDPEMYRDPREWLVHRPSRCALITPLSDTAVIGRLDSHGNIDNQMNTLWRSVIYDNKFNEHPFDK